MPYKDPVKKKEYLERHREQKRENDRRYRLANPHINKEWREKNKEYRKEYMAEWRAENFEHRSEYRKKYTADNSDRIKAAEKIYKAKNRAKINKQRNIWVKTSEKFKQWEIANAEKIKATARKTNLKRYAYNREKFKEFASLYGLISRRGPIFEKWEKADRWCYICGEPVAKKDINIDHVVSIINGGDNDIKNLMSVHRLCNILKRNKTDYPVKLPELVYATACVRGSTREIKTRVPTRWERSQAKKLMDELGEARK